MKYQMQKKDLHFFISPCFLSYLPVIKDKNNENYCLIIFLILKSDPTSNTRLYIPLG